MHLILIKNGDVTGEARWGGVYLVTFLGNLDLGNNVILKNFILFLKES